MNDTVSLLRQHHTLWYNEYRDGIVALRKQFIDSAPIIQQRIFSAGRRTAERILAEERKSKKNHDSFYWITISPPHDVILSDFIQKINQILKLSFMQGAIYAYEQTGCTKETLGHHMHIHLLVPKKVNCSPADIKRRLTRSTRYTIIDVKVFPDEYREDKILYLKGEKWDSDKDTAVEYTKIWRSENNLLSIYNL